MYFSIVLASHPQNKHMLNQLFSHKEVAP